MSRNKPTYKDLESEIPHIDIESAQNCENILLRKLLNGVSEPLALIDPQGNILFANSQFCQLFEKNDENIPGQNYYLLFPPEIAIGIKEKNEEVINTGQKRELEMTYKDHIVLNITSPIFSENNEVSHMSILIADIRDKKISGSVLNKSEEKLKLIFNNLNEAIILHRMVTDEKGCIIDFTFEEINPATERLTNLKSSEVLNKTIRQVIPDIADDLIKKYGDAAITGVPASFEYFSGKSDKYLKIKLFSPKYGYVTTIAEDLTEQKKAEDILNKTILKYRTIFENSVEGIVLIDESGTITEWNKFIENKTGFTKASVIGKKLWEVQNELITDEWKGKYNLESLKGIWINIINTLPDNKIITKEGQYFNTKGQLILTEDIVFSMILNEEKFLCIIQRDITERRNAERELRENEKKLKQINSTKDKLFSIIAHDLRSPFNTILGFSQLLKANIRKYDVEESEKHLDTINSSVITTLNLIINLLSWARNQTGQTIFNPETMTLQHILNEVIDLLTSSAKIKNISINNNLPGNIIVYADKNMVKTILQNLISNAVKFTNPDGKVNIYATPVNGQVEITISDNGTGIRKKAIRNLFTIEANVPEPGTANEIGSGLGLVICREFVEKHGGKIWVESKVGKGSDFKFTLPLNN